MVTCTGWWPADQAASSGEAAAASSHEGKGGKPGSMLDQVFGNVTQRVHGGRVVVVVVIV